ncbi:hypothetical protein ACHAXN_011557 [Cyclotella atomus]
MHNPNEGTSCQSELINLCIDKPSSLHTTSLHHPLAVPTVTPLLHNNSSINAPSPPKLKLTLSAYHRTENTIRLTDACPTKLIHTEYELLDPTHCHTLGHGASSTVRLGYHRRTGKAVAVKTIAKHNALGLCSKDRYRDGKSRLMPRLEEVDVLTLLKGNCKHIIQLMDVYETNTEVHLVLEYCEGGDLFDCIKRRRQRRLLDEGWRQGYPGDFTEREVVGVARTLLGVLKELHERHIVHRDVKPENVLLVNSDEDGCSGLEVTLTDFGLARILHDRTDDDEAASSSDAQSTASSDQEMIDRKQRSRAYTCVGSDFYTAPEVSIGLGYDTPVDMYSLGVTLYVMLCGTPPSASHFNHSLYKIGDESRSQSCTTEDSSSDSEESGPATPTAKSDLFPSELNISPLAQDLVCKLIHPDPDQRITAADALKHEWITQHADDKASALDATTESPSLSKSRSLSTAEAEALLKLPIQGSMYEIAPPVLPPANSPKLSPVPTPPPVSVTLASVCSKLAPILEERRHGKHKRHKAYPRKHSRGAEDRSKPVSSCLSTPPKKVRTEQQPSSAIKSTRGDPKSCSRIRIFGHS